jgi:hypothetical protein
MRDLVDEEPFLAVECSGFAHGDQLGQKISDKPEAQHRIGGVLGFDQRCGQAGEIFADIGALYELADVEALTPSWPATGRTGNTT